jgi:flagellar biosynthesis/type III secretory pathway protein FliH
MFREKRRRDQERRVKEAASQGRAEGHAEGRVEGLAQNQAQWLDWLKRREEAERNNHPFNEPPPSLDESNNRSMR